VEGKPYDTLAKVSWCKRCLAGGYRNAEAEIRSREDFSGVNNSIVILEHIGPKVTSKHNCSCTLRHVCNFHLRERTYKVAKFSFGNRENVVKLTSCILMEITSIKTRFILLYSVFVFDEI